MQEKRPPDISYIWEIKRTIFQRNLPFSQSMNNVVKLTSFPKRDETKPSQANVVSEINEI